MKDRFIAVFGQVEYELQDLVRGSGNVRRPSSGERIEHRSTEEFVHPNAESAMTGSKMQFNGASGRMRQLDVMAACKVFLQRARPNITGTNKNLAGLSQIAFPHADIQVGGRPAQKGRIVLTPREQWPLETYRLNARIAQQTQNELQMIKAVLMERPAARQYAVAPLLVGSRHVQAGDVRDERRYAELFRILPDQSPRFGIGHNSQVRRLGQQSGCKSQGALRLRVHQAGNSTFSKNL